MAKCNICGSSTSSSSSSSSYNSGCEVLYNVEIAIIDPCLIKKYIKFSAKVNEYLQCKYPKYFIYSQLYEDTVVPNKFTIIAAYYNVEGLLAITPEIQADISALYCKTFGNSISPISILSYTTSARVMPSACDCCNE